MNGCTKQIRSKNDCLLGYRAKLKGAPALAVGKPQGDGEIKVLGYLLLEDLTKEITTGPWINLDNCIIS